MLFYHTLNRHITKKIELSEPVQKKELLNLRTKTNCLNLITKTNSHTVTT
jgi:hypothetical protein